MRIGQLVPTVEIAVPIGKETVKVWASPDRMTFDAWSKVKAASGDNPGGEMNDEQVLAATEMLAALVERWDLTDNDGNALPITPEALRRLPVGVLSPIMTAVFASLNPTDAAQSS